MIYPVDSAIQRLNNGSLQMYVVVNFLLQVIFGFLLFLGMVMYANEVENKRKEKIT